MEGQIVRVVPSVKFASEGVPKILGALRGKYHETHPDKPEIVITLCQENNDEDKNPTTPPLLVLGRRATQKRLL